MKICLFGGTFDPPHIGHLLIAQTVCEAESFDKILLFQTSMSGSNVYTIFTMVINFTLH